MEELSEQQFAEQNALLRDKVRAFIIAYDADDGVSMDKMKVRDDALIELRRMLEEK